MLDARAYLIGAKLRAVHELWYDIPREEEFSAEHGQRDQGNPNRNVASNSFTEPKITLQELVANSKHRVGQTAQNRWNCLTCFAYADPRRQECHQGVAGLHL